MSNSKGRSTLLYGVGINDVDAPTHYKVHPPHKYPSGAFKYSSCPYYKRWGAMLGRCHSEVLQEKFPTYRGCTVSASWLYFSNFKYWMHTQDWEEKHLDKDILLSGNKVYSETTCVFIHDKVNSFILANARSRGEFMLGVSQQGLSSYRSDCCDPFIKGHYSGYLGSFPTELSAHLAWKKKKHEYACQLAVSDYVREVHVGDALIERYANYNEYEAHLS